MKKRRNVFLFGAGAVLDWGAPCTPKLTKIVRESGFYTSDGKTRITEFIYQTLINTSGYSEQDINFETIINIIEELMVYYSNHGLLKKVPALIHDFFQPQFEDKILNYTIMGDSKRHIKLRIPGIGDEWAQRNHNDDTPEQFFLQQLLAHILTEITCEIEHYCYHTRDKTNVLTEGNADTNTIFQDWVNKVNGENIVRMYTLNYDRNFKILMERSKYAYSVFEGFDCTDVVGYGEKLRPNIKRILQDQECHTHYNMHGSVFWRVEARNHNQLELPEFFLSSNAHLEVNTDEYPTFQSERGKTIFLSNLITGYQKTQKGIFSPFKQMQAAFDRDCILGDTLYIIGYSFGDEHINSTIRTTIGENDSIKIVIVDPSFTKGTFDQLVALRIFASAKDLHQMQPKTLPHDKNIHSFFGGKIMVHTKNFLQYMQDVIKDKYHYYN
jgi:hypothetical protein